MCSCIGKVTNHKFACFSDDSSTISALWPTQRNKILNRFSTYYTMFTELSPRPTTHTDLELWNGHLERFLTDQSRGLGDLQQERHIGGVQRPAGVRAHCHAKFPLHIHQLENIKQDRFNNQYIGTLLPSSLTHLNTFWRWVQVQNKCHCRTAFDLSIPCQCWAWRGLLAEHGRVHPVHSTTCGPLAEKPWATCYCLLPALTRVHPQRVCSSLQT